MKRVTMNLMALTALRMRTATMRAMMVLAVLLTALTADATEFITDVKLIGYKNKTQFDNLQDKLEKEGWTAIKKDLNAGAGGDYIYLLYKSEENNDGKNHGYITDFYIYGSQNGIFEEEVTFGGRTYYLVPFDGSDDFKKSKGDLNRGCGKGTDYIHLYYTVDPKGNDAVSGIEFTNIQMGALGNMGLSGGITGYNLNAGCSSGEKIYMRITTNNATTQTFKYIKYTYDTTNGLTKKEETCSGYHIVTSSITTFGSANKESWYVLNRSRNFDNRITVSGTVNLILCDGCTLEAKKGSALSYGNTLNIFAQSEGANTGKLKAIATNEEHTAGIGGGNYSAGGTVTIYGGTVEAHGGGGGAGIGGGCEGSGGEVTIYGGAVEAHGGDDAAGIGGGNGDRGGTVTIYGGAVKALGGEKAAGIGGGNGDVGGIDNIYSGTVVARGGTVTIYGGTVEAHGGKMAAGIGGGYKGDGGTVEIYGGLVEAHSVDEGIGAGSHGYDSGTLKIGAGLNVYDIDCPDTPLATGPQDNVESRTDDMFVGKMLPVSYLKYSYNDDSKTLTSKKRYCGDYTEVTSSTTTFSDGWYVLSSSQSFDKRITVSGTVNLILCDGCTLEANKGIEVAKGNTLNIFAQSEGAKAGMVEARSGLYGAGIGGSAGDAGGTVTIYGGTVYAHGDSSCAGIGGGYEGSGGTVTIYGGTVEAHGGWGGAGIGGGDHGSGGTVTIYGGTVEAHSEFGAGIGAGDGGNGNGTLKIDDGVKVYGGDSENPTTVIATGPKNNVERRYRYMIVGGNIKGDANDDFKVNAADLVEMVNAKNNKASDRFVLKNADIDGSGNITKSDIDGVEKIIMQK